RRLLPDTIEVVTHLRSEHDAILADPSRVEQVLLNLAANARDAMPEGGRLSISTRDGHAPVGPADQPEDCVVLTVEDTGVGMSPEVLRQAFEPFFTTKDAGKGTGLGLSTVYGIVKQMRGRITIDSAPGRGTAFFIYLPRPATSPDDALASEPAGQQPEASETRPRRSLVARRPDTVLLVDDERLILTALERGLIREGFRVLSALSAEEALELVNTGTARVDVVVTDVLMPRMNGPELVAQLDEIGLRAPHLFISGFTDNALVDEQVRSSGGLLVKPFTIGELAGRIRDVLARGRFAAEGN
ncbi:MAG: response regulator, partial [Myxococcales bacterium]|nr:response regulator [Myxococcales bacterium]